MANINRKGLNMGLLYLVANIFEKAISFLLLPVFTTLLTPRDYGIVSTYLSYEGIATVVISLALGNSLRGAIIDYKDKIDSYLSSILTLQYILAFIFSIIALMVGQYVISTDFFLLLPIGLAHAFGSCVVGTLILKFMLEAKYVKRTIIAVLPNLIVIFLSIYLIKINPEKPYLGRILALFIIPTILGLFISIWLFVRGKSFINKEYWKYGLRFSLPLIFHGLSLIWLNQIDRAMLTSLRDPAETGLYSAAYSFSTIALAITSAMENVWTPWFYKKMQEEKDNYDIINKNASLYAWSCCCLAIVVAFCAPEIMRWFTNERFWGGTKVIPPLVVGVFFMMIATLPINALYYSKKTSIIATSSFVAAVVNMLLNYWLIPAYGALGAAVTTCIAYMVLLTMQAFVAFKNHRSILGLKTYLLPSFIALLIMPFSAYCSGVWLVRWCVAFVVMLSLIFVIIRRSRNNNVNFAKKLH